MHKILTFGFYLLATSSCMERQRPIPSQHEQALELNEDPAASTVKLAVLGDSGIGEGFINALTLIKKEGASHVVHPGDLAYTESSKSAAYDFDSLVSQKLGVNFPYFYVIGNHDMSRWSTDNTLPYRGYGDMLGDRISRSQSRCFAQNNDPRQMGLMHYCLIDDIVLVFSGVGTQGVRTKHEEYLDETLTQFADKKWKFCVWHKNQRDMQVGRKADEVGWRAYQICQNHGAIILTAHEHSYSRTYTLPT